MTKLRDQSSLTDRYQTTVPTAVRAALGLEKRDKIQYEVSEDGRVYILKAVPEEFDPAVLAFLSFLEKDIIENPGSLRPWTQEDSDRIRALVGPLDLEIDLDAPLEPYDDDDFDDEFDDE